MSYMSFAARGQGLRAALRRILCDPFKVDRTTLLRVESTYRPPAAAPFEPFIPHQSPAHAPASGWHGKHRQNAGVAVELLPRDLAACKETDQGYVAQGIAHHLQLGVPRAEVGAAAARATDVEAARHVMCRAAFHFVADFRRDAHQVELCGLCI